MDRTRHVPICLWGDASSTNPGGVRSYYDGEDGEMSDRITDQQPLTPLLPRDLVVSGCLQLDCFVGSVHHWTVQSFAYEYGSRGARCVTARDFPRGTVLAAYG